jgi:hypothetical protein
MEITDRIDRDRVATQNAVSDESTFPISDQVNWGFRESTRDTGNEKGQSQDGFGVGSWRTESFVRFYLLK